MTGEHHNGQVTVGEIGKQEHSQSHQDIQCYRHPVSDDDLLITSQLQHGISRCKTFRFHQVRSHVLPLHLQNVFQFGYD